MRCANAAIMPAVLDEGTTKGLRRLGPRAPDPIGWQSPPAGRCLDLGEHFRRRALPTKRVQGLGPGRRRPPVGTLLPESKTAGLRPPSLAALVVETYQFTDTKPSARRSRRSPPNASQCSLFSALLTSTPRPNVLLMR